MSELRELYQEMVVEHARRPRNFGALKEASHTALGHNPLCGDKIQIYLHVEKDKVTGISFEGSGCAISVASASLMTESLKNRSLQECQQIFDKFQKLVTGKENYTTDEIGKLMVFSGVREFPVRVKCATLCWHTMKSALEKSDAPATTESGAE